jgi:hypothetical protein
MYARVTAVQATDDHKLILTFDHLERRLFDMRPYLSIGRFAELRDVRLFRQVGISFDTVEWENGLDLDPEFLYAKSVPLSEPVLA